MTLPNSSTVNHLSTLVENIKQMVADSRLPPESNTSSRSKLIDYSAKHPVFLASGKSVPHIPTTLSPVLHHSSRTHAAHVAHPPFHPSSQSQPQSHRAQLPRPLESTSQTQNTESHMHSHLHPPFHDPYAPLQSSRSFHFSCLHSHS